MSKKVTWYDVYYIMYRKSDKKSIIELIKFLASPYYTYPMFEHVSILKSMIGAKKYVKGRLLDVGCGWKPYLRVFLDVVDEYIGIDMPSTESKSEVIDAYANAINLPFKPNCFDTILSTQVLEHCFEPNEMIGEMSRVLKQGGFAILTCPFVWELHEEPYDCSRFTKFGLRYLFEKNGFEVIYIKQRGGFFATIGQMINTYIWRNLFFRFKFKLEKTFRESKFKVKVYFLLFIVPWQFLCGIIWYVHYLIFSSLDIIFPHENLAVGYAIVAKKI